MPRSEITLEYLPTLVEHGLIASVSDDHAPGTESIPDPKLGVVVVFEVQLVCGLCLPCYDFLEAVLRHFQLEVHHISLNSFVGLSTFEMVSRSSGCSRASARAFAHLHCASIR